MCSHDMIRLFNGMDCPELDSIGLGDDSSGTCGSCKVMDCLGPYVDVLFGSRMVELRRDKMCSLIVEMQRGLGRFKLDLNS